MTLGETRAKTRATTRVLHRDRTIGTALDRRLGQALAMSDVLARPADLVATTAGMDRHVRNTASTPVRRTGLITALITAPITAQANAPTTVTTDVAHRPALVATIAGRSIRVDRNSPRVSMAALPRAWTTAVPDRRMTSAAGPIVARAPALAATRPLRRHAAMTGHLSVLLSALPSA